MAELAIVAAIGNGVKLSLSLFDFAYSVGVAAAEIKSLAAEIDLFCAVLTEVGSTMASARPSQISSHATQIIHQVLDRCQEVFHEISTVLAKLHASDRNDFLKRVRWTFQRPQVLLLQQSLRSCAGLLQVMLASVAFSQSVGVRCPSPIKLAKKHDKKQRLTESLLTAQQDLEKLEDLETLCSLEEDLHPSSVEPETDFALTRQATGDYHAAIAECTTAKLFTPVFLAEVGCPERMVGHAECYHAQRTSVLIRDYFDSHMRSRNAKHTKGGVGALLARSSRFGSIQCHLSDVPKRASLAMANTSSTSNVLQLSITGRNKDHPRTSKGFLSANDACWEVLRTAVKANKIPGCWRDYGLFLGWSGIRDRYLLLHWKPLVVLKRLMRVGHSQMPTLTMRKIANIGPTEDRLPVLVFSVEESDAHTRLMEATGFL